MEILEETQTLEILVKTIPEKILVILEKTTIPEKTLAILEKTQALAIQMKEIQEILILMKVKDQELENAQPTRIKILNRFIFRIPKVAITFTNAIMESQYINHAPKA